jgi:valyl-tRNA synthetase
MDTRFDHKKLEPQIYRRWEKSGFFNPDNLVKGGIIKKDAKKFSIILPPPNVTGILHMGSAFMLVIEDIMIRFNRMLGKQTLWLPGMDHAAIATEAKVAKILWEEEKKVKHDLGRIKFLERIDEFVGKNRAIMTSQIRAMGSSLDWSREAFTLDKERVLAVKTAFKKMYDEGLIYRGNRIVNWDPRAKTTISDDEVIYKKSGAKLYTFKYSKYVPIPIATTRPETKLGDTAIAVHPNDKRYKKYIGETYSADFAGEKITLKVIGDKSVDPKFGTGALGVTPAHSIIDWEIAVKNGLPIKQVIDEDARLMVGIEGVKGEKTMNAREAVVGWLKKNGLLEKVEEIDQNISTSERTGAVVEPLPKLQWFIDVNKEFTIKNSKINGVRSGQKTTLKKIMQTTVKSGQIKILPKRFEKDYFHWIDNLRDWCISRQLWYGHEIPVWYRDKELYVDIEPPKGNGWIQDPDTFDTWFSSALWTFSTLGWPKKTADLKKYHPIDILETAYDILFFWVARMILMSGYHLGEVPFETVYLHGIVRDEQNRKLSKSLGNNINPLDMIDLYGADAVRMSLIIGTAPGGDSKISEDKIRGYRNFTTKVWNASRFVLLNYDEKLNPLSSKKPTYTKEDKLNLKRLEDLKKRTTKYIEEYKFHQASELLYHYFWHTFADKIIEKSKKRLSHENNPSDRAAVQVVLLAILKENLKMLHPFMPFITEEIWSQLPGNTNKNLLIIEKW